MRRCMLAIGMAGLLGAAAVTAASAATPPVRHHFSGSGGVYWNQGSSWARGGTGSFRFRTSGRVEHSVKQFYGTYSPACDSGTLHVVAPSIPVSTHGTFRIRGRQTLTHSVAYIQVWGQFKGNGRSAHVEYLVDFVRKGQHVSNPYDTGHPARLGCASWVRGTARG